MNTIILDMVTGQGHSDPNMVCDTLPSQDAPIHHILDSSLQLCRRYAPDMIILEIRSTVKLTLTPKMVRDSQLFQDASTH